MKANLSNLETISKEDLYWLAGLLEGEGSFMLRSCRKHHPRVSLAMTDEDVVAKSARLVGISYHNKSIKNPKHKDAFSWDTSGVRAAKLMQLLLPLMGKRRQAKIKECLTSYVPEHTHRGEEHHNSKLTSLDVREIRIKKRLGWTYKKLGKLFGVSRHCLWTIVSRRGWKHVA